MLRNISVLLILSAIAYGAKFPENQQKCYYGDSACMVEVANDIMSRGKQGYPALGLPIFDPLRIDQMAINQGNGGPVSIKINFKNFELRGLSDVRFTKISGFNKDFDRTKMQFNYIYPTLSIYGPYKLEGKVLVLPVQGDGIANMTFYENDSVFKILTRKINKQGKSYLVIEKSRLNFETAKVSIHFGNLFNGNRELGDTTNSFFNENWRDILKEIKPAVASAVADIYETLINNVFSSIPYDDMFLS